MKTGKKEKAEEKEGKGKRWERTEKGRYGRAEGRDAKREGKKGKEKLTFDSSQLTFLPSSKSHDTKTTTNIKNLTRTNLDIVP